MIHIFIVTYRGEYYRLAPILYIIHRDFAVSAILIFLACNKGQDFFSKSDYNAACYR